MPLYTKPASALVV